MESRDLVSNQQDSGSSKTLLEKMRRDRFTLTELKEILPWRVTFNGSVGTS